MEKCRSRRGGSEKERISNHPCFSEKAHHYFARMHLAVAPRCNIQCNYCNRKYDCTNESRPGVISEHLTPDEALKKVYYVSSRVPELSVIGIAGPGDSLADAKRTFSTMRVIKGHFPDLKLCLSTNGLSLAENVEEIIRTGVDHVNVTLNTFSPKTALKIYDWVLIEGKKRRGLEAVSYFLAKQQEGIRILSNLGILVKVNSILMPGINDLELPGLSKKIKLMGAFMHNIMPLISRPEHGTRFGLERRPEPTANELELVREKSGNIKQMAHCRQCRADAVGKLDQDLFSDFTKKNFVGLPLPEDNSKAKRDIWKQRVEYQIHQGKKRAAKQVDFKDSSVPDKEYLIAACTKDLGIINQHFGHAKEFYIYKVNNGRARIINVRQLKNSYCSGDEHCNDHDRRFKDILEVIGDCHAVICLKVGYAIHRKLEERGIQPVVDLALLPVEEAVIKAAKKLGPLKVIQCTSKTQSV